MSNDFLFLTIVQVCLLLKPCKAAVEDIPCNDSNVDKCIVYGNSHCDANKCRCRNDFYDNGSTCQKYIKRSRGVVSPGCIQKRSTGTFCKCDKGQYWTGSFCNTQKSRGEVCTFGAECLSPFTCTGGTCECATNQYWTGSMCASKILVDQGCTDKGPSDQCKDSKSRCSLTSGGYKCACVTNYYNVAGSCTLQTALGYACDPLQTGECKDLHSSCVPVDSVYTCLCNVKYYDNSGTCTIQVELENSCTANRPDNQCRDQNAECKDSNSLRCLCKDTFYKNSNGVCNKKVELNATCIAGELADQCSDSKAVCTSSKICYCQNGYFENSGIVCTKKVLLNDVCNTGQSQYQCEDVNSECKWESGTSTEKCLCKKDFYANYANVCLPKSALGEVCSNGQPVNQCFVADSECIAEIANSLVYRCFCKGTFYRDVQTCKDLTGLRVQNLKVPRDTTGEVYFMIKWTIPNTVAFINKYQIKITVSNGKAETLIDIVKTENQYNMINRQPGHTYIVEVISVETASRPGIQATSVDLQTSTRPAVPSAIITNDILGPSITVSWTIVGIIQHLSGTINGTSVTPKTFNTTQIPSQTFNYVKNSERYVITVKASSNGFTSAEFTDTIRTTSTKPNPPVINTCDNQDLYEYHMDLRWKEPQVPNGDISHYIIYMSGTEVRTIKTDSSTEVQTVENLLPDQYYCFQIETVNDAVSPHSNKSPRSSQVCCKTRAGVPEIHNNVVTTVQSATVIQVSWTKPTVKPGNTTYRIKAYEVLGGTYTYVKDIKVNGYEVETVDFTGLEEYWDYTFTVTASTIKGAATSAMTTVVKTNQAPPGKVTKFEIMTPANVFTTMQVSWAIPLLRERNSIIKKYIIKHNISGITIVETIPAESEMVQQFYYITPDRYYKVELYAANILNQHGEKLQKIYFASSTNKAPLSNTGYSIGTVVGAAVGSVLCSVFVLVFIFWFLRRHRKNKTSKPSNSKDKREESKFGDQYEDLGMDNVSSYQDLGAKYSPNVYEQIGRVHTIEKHYENMIP